MTISALIAKVGELIAFPVERDRADPARAGYERLAIPHSFKPRLTVVEASIAAGGAMVRIFLGSLLFAVWGTSTWMAWAALPNVFLRSLFLLVSVALFLICLVALLIGVSAIIRRIWPQRARP